MFDNSSHSLAIFLGSVNNVLFGAMDNFVESLPIPAFLADAIIDTVHMIPFLLVIFLLVELLERRFGKRMQHGIEKAAVAGPLLGALFGCIPQCGFSIIATALYTRKIVTLGTLLAVYLSTSDEAVPVILSQPEKAHLVAAILATKLVIAIVAGYLIDFIFKQKAPVHVHTEDDILDSSEDSGCCSHTITGYRAWLKSLGHTVTHTLKISLFVFLVTLGINYLVLIAGGEANLGRYLFAGSAIQPIITAVFGLIPNCASSVAITLAYLNGGLSFGSVISGLCTSAGLGLLVLVKENHDTRDVLRITGILVTVSAVSGIILQFLT